MLLQLRLKRLGNNELTRYLTIFEIRQTLLYHRFGYWPKDNGLNRKWFGFVGPIKEDRMCVYTNRE